MQILLCLDFNLKKNILKCMFDKSLIAHLVSNLLWLYNFGLRDFGPSSIPIVIIRSLRHCVIQFLTLIIYTAYMRLIWKCRATLEAYCQKNSQSKPNNTRDAVHIVENLWANWVLQLSQVLQSSPFDTISSNF